jgi:hypothetical protein
VPESARQRGHASRTVWIDIGSPSCISKPVNERGDGRIAADSTRGSRWGGNTNYMEQISSSLFSMAHRRPCPVPRLSSRARASLSVQSGTSTSRHTP